MNNFKKILTIALALSMILVMASCGDSDSPKKFDFDDYSKYITLGDYTALTYEVEEVTVTDEEVQDQIDLNLQAAQVTNELTEGVVTSDDKVNISYVGKLDGEEFEGGSGENYTLDIANSLFIDGFAEGLVGAEVGDMVSLNLTFPEDYGNEELAGQDVVFDVTVNSIIVVTTPEYTVDYVKENSDYETKEEYEQAMKESMLQEKEDYAVYNAQSNMFLELVDNTEMIEYPEKELEETKTQAIDYYKDMAEMYSMEYEEFVLQQMGLSLEDFELQAEDYAKTTVKSELVIYAVAKEEGIEITDEEYQQFLDDALEQAGYDRESFKAANDEVGIEEYAIENGMYTGMLSEKVIERLVELNK